MFVIDKFNKIMLTKGDTATLYIEAFDSDGIKYDIKDTDVITLTVRKTSKAEVASIVKQADAQHYITFNPQDTSSLAVGLYVYDVQLVTVDGYVYTIVPTSYFELKDEVTR